MVTTVSLHAFVDESRRNDRYLLAAAFIDPRDLRRHRKLLGRLLMPGQRELHFKREKTDRRKAILSKLVVCGPVVRIYEVDCAESEEQARTACLIKLVGDLLDQGATRLVLDSREVRDRHDRMAIRRILGKHPSKDLVYEHLDSTSDPLLWIADVVAWCYGAGGEWRRRAAPLVACVVDLDNWSR